MNPSDRCDAELKRTDHDLKYQAIFETVMEGIITIDQSGLILDTNPAAQEIFGYQALELTGQNVSLLMPEPDRSRHNRYITAFLENRDPKIIGQGRTVKGVRKNGDIFDMHLAVSSMKLADGEFFVGCIRDISQQRLAEKQLNVSQERLKISQDFAEIGTWDWDVQKDELYWSQKTFELLDYNPLLGSGQPQYHHERVHPEDQLRKNRSIKNCLKTGTTYDIDYRVLYENGSVRWMNEKGNVLRSEDGRAVRMLGIIQDVTHHREYEESLERLKDEAVKASRAKSEFLSHISHELRTPLNAILGFAQLMGISKTNPLNERQTSQVNHIVDAGNHLLNLINEVLDLSTIEAGKVEFNEQLVQISELGEECFALLSPLAADQEIALVSKIDPDLTLVADRVRLKQVLINLLSNAIKYNRPKGQVELEVAPHPTQKDTLLFKVIDTGHGIALEKREEIFLPFNRVAHTQSEIVGSGLGLPLTKKIIEAMGGQIGVDSQLGEGSTFWFELKDI